MVTIILTVSLALVTLLFSWLLITEKQHRYRVEVAWIDLCQRQNDQNEELCKTLRDIKKYAEAKLAVLWMLEVQVKEDGSKKSCYSIPYSLN